MPNKALGAGMEAMTPMVFGGFRWLAQELERAERVAHVTQC